MTAYDVLREELGPETAYDVRVALKDAGYIIVRHDAIRLAQAHERETCRYEAANDNRVQVRPVADMLMRLCGS